MPFGLNLGAEADLIVPAFRFVRIRLRRPGKRGGRGIVDFLKRRDDSQRLAGKLALRLRALSGRAGGRDLKKYNKTLRYRLDGGEHRFEKSSSAS